ncbi:MAG: phosphatidate cytidylyltransferase [Neisseriales bacterium]|nr:MAG: phosphatidate cytidylyltransferase [Neisseriales bacterium]
MFKKRVVTACFLLLITVNAVFYCPPFLWMIITGMVVQGLLWEFAKMTRMTAAQVPYYLLTSALLQGLLWLVKDQLGWIASAVILVFWLGIAPLWLVKRWPLLPNWTGWVTGWLIFLPAWMAFQVLRPLPAMGRQLLVLMGIVWVADTVAYITGKLYGKHKLADHISPGKSWEGFIGGLIGTLLYSVLLDQLGYLPISLSRWAVPALAILLCITSVIGDLLESWFKREAAIKDSSYLLPGHGGLYDRMDGLVAVLAVSMACLVITQ